MEHKTPPLGLNVSLSSYLSSFWPGNRVSSNSCSNLAMIIRASNWANVCPIQFLGPRANGKNTDCWIGLLTSGENLSGLNFSGSCHASESRWNINELIVMRSQMGWNILQCFHLWWWFLQFRLLVGEVEVLPWGSVPGIESFRGLCIPQIGGTQAQLQFLGQFYRTR